MEAFTRRLSTLILTICANLTRHKQILLAVLSLCFVGLWLVGTAHFLHTSIHETGLLPHLVGDHDPWD